MKFLAVGMGKAASFVSKMIGRDGLALPGKVASKIDPNLLKEIASSFEIILITGTNGKTQTTAFARAMIEDSISNEGGANLYQGIVTTFLKNKEQKKYAILECDEATLPQITREISPKYILITNIFEDQKDRFSSPYEVLNLLYEGIENAKEATVILNEDNLMVSALHSSMERLPNKVISVGSTYHNPNQDGHDFCPFCGHLLYYKTRAYGETGNYECECNARRKSLDVTVQIADKKTWAFFIERGGEEDSFCLPSLLGIHGVYNFALAYALMKELGISKKIKDEEIPRIFGRNKVYQVKGYRGEMFEICPYLVKNKDGANRIFDLMRKDREPYDFALLINNEYADGKDVSWINDLIPPQSPKYIGGSQKDLLYQRFPHAEEFDKILLFYPRKKMYLLGNYTALMSLRRDFDEMEKRGELY